MRYTDRDPLSNHVEDRRNESWLRRKIRELSEDLFPPKPVAPQTPPPGLDVPDCPPLYPPLPEVPADIYRGPNPCDDPFIINHNRLRQRANQGWEA
ncbi:MAG: hypothetical protein U0931_28970 [Vulcanimicrobiota bacterium]